MKNTGLVSFFITRIPLHACLCISVWFLHMYMPIIFLVFRHLNLKKLLVERRKKLENSRKLQQFLRDVHEVSNCCNNDFITIDYHDGYTYHDVIVNPNHFLFTSIDCLMHIMPYTQNTNL